MAAAVRMGLSFLTAGLLVACTAASAEPAAPPAAPAAAPVEYAAGRELARLANRTVSESSGIAASRVHEGVFWTHNDSGGRAELYAFNAKGEDLGTYKVPGANVDWEDICAFKAGDKGCLAVADTGDNLHVRRSYTIYICEEPEKRPEPGGRQAAELKLVRKVEFAYADGSSRDCEAVAAEPDGSVLYLASKIRSAKSGGMFSLEPTVDGRLFALDLKGAGNDEKLKAREIAVHKWLNVTAMDISPDGRRAVLLTYVNAHEFTRAEGQTWEGAFKGEPREIALPARPQGEGITYGTDGKTLYLTSESSKGCPLYAVEPKAAGAGAKPEAK
ncbi:MAG TPA: hypothetical protein PK280_04320 [Planctomycetota bacterium]|nr:hypothetical protein [Planctomycetota bacterium]